MGSALAHVSNYFLGKTAGGFKAGTKLLDPVSCGKSWCSGTASTSTKFKIHGEDPDRGFEALSRVTPARVKLDLDLVPRSIAGVFYIIYTHLRTDAWLTDSWLGGYTRAAAGGLCHGDLLCFNLRQISAGHSLHQYGT